MSSRAVTDQELLAYAAGEMTGEAAWRVERHLAIDAEAARRVALYRLAARTVADDDSVDPPVETAAPAKALFAHRRAARRPNLIERLEAVVARLVFDSRLQPLAVRRHNTGQRFQLAFETDTTEVELQAEPVKANAAGGSADRWRLMGQISADPPPANVDVVVLRAGAASPAGEARSDAQGVFTTEIEPGCYDLRLHLPTGLVVLANIEVS